MVQRTAALVLLSTLAATGVACSPHQPTFRCAGNDEIFRGVEGPCGRTGTITGVVHSFMGGALNGPVKVSLHARFHAVLAKQTDATGHFTFHVNPGRFTATSEAFGVICYGQHPVTVKPAQVVRLVVFCSEP